MIAGYFSLYNFSSLIEGHTVCIFKNVTGFPCPACGSTRATLALLHGKILNSIRINPFGILSNTLIVISVFWMSFDIARGKETFFPFLKRDWNLWIKIIIALIVIVNWVWNIGKRV
jgi:hypothetical protein